MPALTRHSSVGVGSRPPIALHCAVAVVRFVVLRSMESHFRPHWSVISLIRLAEQSTTHEPPSQTWFAAQVLPHEPQLFLFDDTSMHAPLQSDWPAGQPATHAPAVQTWFAPQTTPPLPAHAPQLLLSVLTLVQVPPHALRPEPQKLVHAPDMQS